MSVNLSMVVTGMVSFQSVFCCGEAEKEAARIVLIAALF